MSNSNFSGIYGQFEAQIFPDLHPNFTDEFIDFENYFEQFDTYNYFGGIDQPNNNEDSSSNLSHACLSSRSHVSQDSVDTSLEGLLPENTNIVDQGLTRVEDGNDDEHRVVAFRVKTAIEILEDGYKWRKYGKKKVKCNSYPRNYYKCNRESCKVKKRVERDPQDSSYVITTYEGVHNHHSQSQAHISHTHSLYMSQ